MDLEFAEADYLPDLFKVKPDPGIEEEGSVLSEEG